MFDPLLEDDPWVKEKVAESEARGIAKGEARGKVESLRRVLIDIVTTRFPSLIPLAEAKTAQIEQPDTLNVLVVQISAAANEQAVRRLLEDTHV